MRKVRNAVLALLFASTFVFFCQPREVKAANDPSPRFEVLGRENLSDYYVVVMVDHATGAEMVCMNAYGTTGKSPVSCNYTGRKR